MKGWRHCQSSHAFDDTIAAIATAVGKGGIGIIRLSGQDSIAIAEKLFKAKCGLKVNEFQSHKLYYGHLVYPETENPIDEGLLVVMKKPCSYTREDIVEIQLHGGPVVLNQALEMVIGLGARLALPGEFTKRAFLNGRIDLTQAEAVAELIAAKSSKELELQKRKLEGGLHQKIEKLIAAIQSVVVDLEADIEFNDQIEFHVDEQALMAGIEENILAEIQSLIKNYQSGRIYFEGIRVAITGLPNVGKSTLLNRLIDKEKAIVTEFPGTTRDLIEEFIVIEQIPFYLTDTAGIQETNDPVEKIGIQRAQKAISEANLILSVVDCTDTIGAGPGKMGKCLGHKTTITVLNKIDLKNDTPAGKLRGNSGQEKIIAVSAKYGHGIEALKQEMVECALRLFGSGEFDGIAPNLRQKTKLESAAEKLSMALENLKNRSGFELVVMDLEDALFELKSIVGKEVSEGVLDEIFMKFCIGK